MLIKESEGSTVVLSVDFGSCCLWTSFPFNTGTLTKLQRKSVESDVRLPFFCHADCLFSFPSVSQQTKIFEKTRVGKKMKKWHVEKDLFLKSPIRTPPNLKIKSCLNWFYQFFPMFYSRLRMRFVRALWVIQTLPSTAPTGFPRTFPGPSCAGHWFWPWKQGR